MSKNTGKNYDANAMLTLAEVTDGRYVAGTCVAVRTTGQEGKTGNVYGYAPAIGVCPKGSRNRYKARAKRVQGAYMLLPDDTGHLVLFKSRDKARDDAHKKIQRMGATKLATYTTEQRASIKAIAAIRSSLRKVQSARTVLVELKASTVELDKTIKAQNEGIAVLEATLN